jgi:hypothetical protein
MPIKSQTVKLIMQLLLERRSEIIMDDLILQNAAANEPGAITQLFFEQGANIISTNTSWKTREVVDDRFAVPAGRSVLLCGER